MERSTVIAAVALAGLLASAGSARPDAQAPSLLRVSLQPVAQRKPAPSFALRDSHGRTIRLSDYRGRVLLLDLWATACGGCIREIPAFVEIANAYRRKGLQVVGISEDVIYEELSGPDEAWTKVTPFVREHHVPYTILMGDRSDVGTFNIQALPLTHLIDRDGRVAATYAGAIADAVSVKSNVEALLTERRR